MTYSKLLMNQAHAFGHIMKVQTSKIKSEGKQDFNNINRTSVRLQDEINCPSERTDICKDYHASTRGLDSQLHNDGVWL